MESVSGDCMLTETQPDTGKNMWMISCLLTSYSDEYPWFWSLFLGAVLIGLCQQLDRFCGKNLYLMSSERERAPSKCYGVMFHCTEFLVMHSHYGNNPLLHSSNLHSLSDKITSSQPLPKVRSPSVTYLVLKILHCCGEEKLYWVEISTTFAYYHKKTV